jgi:hypothetical protein
MTETTDQKSPEQNVTNTILKKKLSGIQLLFIGITAIILLPIIVRLFIIVGEITFKLLHI